MKLQILVFSAAIISGEWTMWLCRGELTLTSPYWTEGASTGGLVGPLGDVMTSYLCTLFFWWSTLKWWHRVLCVCVCLWQSGCTLPRYAVNLKAPPTLTTSAPTTSSSTRSKFESSPQLTSSWPPADLSWPQLTSADLQLTSSWPQLTSNWPQLTSADLQLVCFVCLCVTRSEHGVVPALNRFQSRCSW